MSFEEMWQYPSRSTGRGVPGFADPFCDAASLAMPTTLNDSHAWVEQVLLSSQGTYRTALDRIVSYFITPLVIGDAKIDRAEKDKYVKYAKDSAIPVQLRYIGIDFLSYGNVIISLVQRMQRRVICPKRGCGTSVPFSEFSSKSAYKFKFSSFAIHGHCPRCGFTGDFGKPKDMPLGDQTPLVIHRWNLKDIEIAYHPISHRKEYYWKIPEEVAGPIRAGIAFNIEDTPWEVIEAVRDNMHLKLDSSNILHLCEDTLSGIRMRGWGLSRVLANFRQAWYVQVLHRQNEAIAMDYVTPRRVVSPSPRAGADPAASDPVLSGDLSNFKVAVENMIEKSRRDPAAWMISPYPIDYKILGGDANVLAPKELIELGQLQLLDSIGIFQELYKGSLQTQAAPLALRLHEAYWMPLRTALDQAARFIFEQTAKLYHWQEVEVSFEAPSSSDDIQRSAVKLQLAQSQAIGMGTALAPLGLDFVDEQKKVIEEQQIAAELQADAQEDMERAQQMSALVQPPSAAAGGMPPGGAPPQGGAPAPAPAPGGAPAPAPGAPPGAAQQFAMAMPNQPNMPKTPESMMSEAQGISDQLLTLPPQQRRSELSRLKQQDPTTHMLVTSMMSQTRSQARSQGGQQMMQQQYGTA